MPSALLGPSQQRALGVELFGTVAWQSSPGKMVISLGFHWDFNGDIMGFTWELMGCHGDFNGDLLGFCWGELRKIR